MNRGYRCTKHCRKCEYFDFYKVKCKIGRVNYEMLDEEELQANPNLKLDSYHCNKKGVNEVMELINKALKK